MTYNPFTWLLVALALIVVGIVLLVQGSEVVGLIALAIGGFALGFGLARRRALAASERGSGGAVADDEPTLHN